MFHSILQFEQAGLSLNDPQEYFTNHSNYKQLKTALVKFMSQFGILLGADKTTVGNKMEELYLFEQQLANVSIHEPEEQIKWVFDDI